MKAGNKLTPTQVELLHWMRNKITGLKNIVESQKGGKKA